MSRRWLLLLVVPVLVAFAGSLIAAAGAERDLVWRSNAFPGQVVPVKRDRPVCQTNIDPAEAFSAARFGVAGEDSEPGPRLQVIVQTKARRELARGVLASGYAAQALRTVRFDRPVAGQNDLRVCFRNLGRRLAVLYGTPANARGAEVTIGGRKKVLTLQMDLTRHRRTALEMLGTIVQRASVQRPDPLGPWVYWLLAGLVLLAVPALSAGALRAATKERPSGGPGR